MQKSKSRENISTSADASDKNSTSSKTLPSVDFTGLMTDLNTLNSEGNSLMKQSKLEDLIRIQLQKMTPLRIANGQNLRKPDNFCRMESMLILSRCLIQLKLKMKYLVILLQI